MNATDVAVLGWVRTLLGVTFMAGEKDTRSRKQYKIQSRKGRGYRKK